MSYIPLFLLAGCLFPPVVLAEPGVSQKFMPYLWAFGVLVACLLCWFVMYVLTSIMGRLVSTASKWIAAIIILAIFLVTATPLVVILGGIFITGRTM